MIFTKQQKKAELLKGTQINVRSLELQFHDFNKFASTLVNFRKLCHSTVNAFWLFEQLSIKNTSNVLSASQGCTYETLIHLTKISTFIQYISWKVECSHTSTSKSKVIFCVNDWVSLFLCSESIIGTIEWCVSFNSVGKKQNRISQKVFIAINQLIEFEILCVFGKAT